MEVGGLPAALMPNQCLLRAELSKYLWNSWTDEYVSPPSTSEPISCIQHTLWCHFFTSPYMGGPVWCRILLHSRNESTLGTADWRRSGHPSPVDSRGAHSRRPGFYDHRQKEELGYRIHEIFFQELETGNVAQNLDLSLLRDVWVRLIILAFVHSYIKPTLYLS